MTDAQRTRQASDHRRVAGRYELVGLNGSLLPVEVEEDGSEEGPEVRAFLVEGELHRRRGPDYTWVYIRRGAARRVWSGE